MSIGCVAIAGGPQDVVSSSGALWEHQTAETARGRKWCIRYRVTGLRNSVLSIANAPTGESSVLLCGLLSGALALPVLWKSRLASISTVPERTNAASFWGDQANSMTSFLFPNHGIGVCVSASPEATRYGL